jgi:hypothetical protein
MRITVDRRLVRLHRQTEHDPAGGGGRGQVYTANVPDVPTVPASVIGIRLYTSESVVPELVKNTQWMSVPVGSKRISPLW